MTDLLKCHFVEKTGNVLTPRGRFYFCAVAERFQSKEDKAKSREGTYVITTVIPPTADLSVLTAKIKQCAVDKWGAKLPGNLKSPIRKCSDVFDKNGDPKYPEELKDHYQITANTYKQQPNVVDEKGNPISRLLPGESTDDLKARMKEHCYSGRWGRISVQPATYDTDGNRGVKLYLQNVQVLDHDEVLGGRGAKAEDDFVPVQSSSAKGSSDSIFDVAS